MQSSSSSESDSESSDDDNKNKPTKNRGNLNHNKPAEVNTRQANRMMNLPQQPVTPTTPSKKEVCGLCFSFYVGGDKVTLCIVYSQKLNM